MVSDGISLLKYEYKLNTSSILIESLFLLAEDKILFVI